MWSAVGMADPECAWSRTCWQPPHGDSPFCYWHLKRATGLADGRVSRDGRQLDAELEAPSERARELIDAMRKDHDATPTV